MSAAAESTFRQVNVDRPRRIDRVEVEEISGIPGTFRARFMADDGTKLFVSRPVTTPDEMKAAVVEAHRER